MANKRFENITVHRNSPCKRAFDIAAAVRLTGTAFAGPGAGHPAAARLTGSLAAMALAVRSGVRGGSVQRGMPPRCSYAAPVRADMEQDTGPPNCSAAS